MKQVLWPFDQVVKLIVGRILDDDPIVQVQVIVESKDVHGAVVNLVRLLRVLLVVVFELLVESPLLHILLLGMAVLVAKVKAIPRLAFLDALVSIVE